MSEEWQDISTAAPPKPSRERPFLARHRGGYWGLVYWSDKVGWYATYWDGDPVPAGHPITHWMLLPEPPRE